MKQLQRKYSKEDLEQILSVFSKKGNTAARLLLAGKLNRTVAALQSKYYWETKGSDLSKAKIAADPSKDEVKLTVLNNKKEDFQNPFLAKKETVVLVGETKIIIPSNRFTINGVTIEY